MTATTEEWRPIPGYDGYQASNLGRIRSLRIKGEPRILSGGLNTGGYRQVSCRTEAGLRKTVTVHKLVALAFLGQVHEFTEANTATGLTGRGVVVRLCRRCSALRSAAYMARKRAAA